MGCDCSDAFTEVAWDEVPLSELTSANVTYGVVQPGAAVPDGVPMIRVNNFSGHTLNLCDVMRISHDVERKYERTRIRANDVLITVVGSVGQVAVVPSELAGWNIARAVALIRPRSIALARWIAHFLRSPLAQHRMGVAANTTVQTTVNLKDLRAMHIPMPPESIRRGICGLLDALDDRIDLLRQTNTTLEAIAQALFKSWFVDFDPVRAKAEGREPEGMDATTAALFPNEFEESDLGLIPKGWNVGTFADIALQSKGSVSPLKSPETEHEHYSLPAFDAGLMPVHELGEAIKSNKTPVPNDAILISKLNPHIPRIWFTGKVHANAVCSTEFLVWTPARGITPEYVFCLAVSVPFNTAMKQLVTGTSNSHQRVKPDHLKSIPTIIPPVALTQAFGTFVGPLLKRVQQNRSIAQSLARLRDTLLPRLISGKLRLPDAEEALEDVIA